MHNLPLAIHFDHYAALVVRSDFDAFGQCRADHHGIAGNGSIAVALDVQVGQVKA